jgi:Fe2+ transport system protein B
MSISVAPTSFKYDDRSKSFIQSALLIIIIIIIIIIAMHNFSR